MKLARSVKLLAEFLKDQSSKIWQNHAHSNGNMIQTSWLTEKILISRSKPVEDNEWLWLILKTFLYKNGSIHCANQDRSHLFCKCVYKCGVDRACVWSTPSFTGLAETSVKYPSPYVSWLALICSTTITTHAKRIRTLPSRPTRSVGQRGRRQAQLVDSLKIPSSFGL